MKTMKLFRNLFIIFILLFIFVGFMSKAFIESTYTSISKSEIISDIPKIEIIEAKVTNVNGFMIAKITNNSQEMLDDKYIKLDFFSKNDNNIGTKYLKINNLNKNEAKEFKLDYKFDGVKKIKGEIVEDAPEMQNVSLLSELSSEERMGLTFASLIITYYMPVGFIFKLLPI